MTRSGHPAARSGLSHVSTGSSTNGLGRCREPVRPSAAAPLGEGGCWPGPRRPRRVEGSVQGEHDAGAPGPLGPLDACLAQPGGGSSYPLCDPLCMVPPCDRPPMNTAYVRAAPTQPAWESWPCTVAPTSGTRPHCCTPFGVSRSAPLAVPSMPPCGSPCSSPPCAWASGRSPGHAAHRAVTAHTPR